MAHRALGKQKRSLPNIKQMASVDDDKYQTLDEIEREFKRLARDQRYNHEKKTVPHNKYSSSNNVLVSPANASSQGSTSKASFNPAASQAYGLFQRNKSQGQIRISKPDVGLEGSKTSILVASGGPPDRRMSYAIGSNINVSLVESKFGITVPTNIPPGSVKDFILDRLQEKLKGDLEHHYLTNVKEDPPQQLSVKEFEKMMSEMINFRETDVGAWVKIHSSYKMLRKKLQAKLVEFISDELSFKNYDIKLSYDHEETKLDEEYDALFESIEQKILAAKRVEIPINYMMRRRLQEESDKKAVEEKIKEDIIRQEKKQRAMSAHPRYLDEAKKKPKPMQPEANTPETIAAQVVWSNKDEQAYKANVQEGKQKFSSKVATGTFKNIGFRDIYLSLRKKSNLHNLRDFLLEKYQSGKWLTDKELKYLTYSSGLTHAVIDKEYYRDAIQHISAEVKSDIITMIADDMISEYSNIIQSLSDARTTYLAIKNQKHRAKAHQYMLQLQRENESLLRILALKKWRLVNSRFCLKRLALSEMKSEEEKTKTKPDLDMAAQILNERRTTNRNKFLRRNFTKPIASNYLGLIEPKKLRHLQCPASKVIKFPAKGTIDDMNTTDKQAEDMLQTMYDYKNSIVDQNAIDASRYKRQYSGGPVSRRKEPRLMKKEQAALLIQKAWRGYFDRRMIKYLKSMTGKKFNKMFRGVATEPDLVPCGVSNFFTRFTILKNTLLNPQNEQKLRVQFMEETRIKNQREFTKKVDKEIREKIMKGRGIKKSPSLIHVAEKIPELEEAEKEEQEKPPKKSIYTKNNLHIKQTALLNACKNNKTSWLQNSAYNYTKHDVNIPDNLGNTALYYACQNKNIFIVYYLLKRGAYTNKKCEQGNTPVHAAFKKKEGIEETEKILNDQVELIKLLVEYHADLDAANQFGQTPIAFGSANLLKRTHLYEGKATLGEKTDIPERGGKPFNNKLFEEDCREKPKDSVGFYAFRRISSASTLSFSRMEQYCPNPQVEDIYMRREKYLASEEYLNYMAEREGRHLKEGEFISSSGI